VSKSNHDPASAGGEIEKNGSSRIGSRLALVFGLIGMLTGVLGLVFSYRAQHEQEVLKFAAFPHAALSDLTGAGLTVRVQLVNQSLRPVVVQGASLWNGNERLANASGYLQDTRILDNPNSDPAELTSELADLPLNIGAREGRTTALLLDVWSGISSATISTSQAAQQNLNLALNGLNVGLYPRSPLTLELDLAPGGPHRFVLAGAGQTTAMGQGGSAKQPTWLVSPLGRPPRLIGLLLRHTSAAVGEVELVRLDLWNQTSAFHETTTRPVLSEQATTFPLANLPRGTYSATFELGGEVIAHRSFSVPWLREPCAVGLQEATALDGTASPAWC
jgi:hypothetical protein